MKHLGLPALGLAAILVVAVAGTPSQADPFDNRAFGELLFGPLDNDRHDDRGSRHGNRNAHQDGCGKTMSGNPHNTACGTKQGNRTAKRGQRESATTAFSSTTGGFSIRTTCFPGSGCFWAGATTTNPV